MTQTPWVSGYIPNKGRPIIALEYVIEGLQNQTKLSSFEYVHPV